MSQIGKRRLLKAHIRCGHHRRESIERLTLRHKMYVDQQQYELANRKQIMDVELRIMDLRHAAHQD